MNIPEKPETYTTIQISDTARKLIQKQTSKSLMYSSTDPKSVLEQFVAQNNCTFEEFAGKDGKTPTINCKNEHGELVGFMEYSLDRGTLSVIYRKKFIYDPKYRGFSTGILAYYLSQLSTQPTKIQNILSDKNKSKPLLETPAYKSFAQFGYTKATRTKGPLEHWTFAKV